MGPRLSGDKTPLLLTLTFTTQDPKIREVLGFGGPDARLEEKLMTVVAGPDPVNIMFLNFMAVQDDTVKVGWDQEITQGREKMLHWKTLCSPGWLQAQGNPPA